MAACKLVYRLVLLLFYWFKGMVMVFVPKSLRYKDVSKDIVLVTGGGSGIGRLLAIKFARKGSTVVIWDINEAGMKETSREIKKLTGLECHTFVCDVSNRVQVYEIARTIKETIGVVTILINNAGVVNGKRFLDIEDEKIVRLMDINLMAHFWTTKAFLPDMLAGKRGHLVTISSVAGLTGTCNLTDYCAAKFGNIGFEEALRYELLSDGHDHVQSTVVCPWFIDTGLFAGVKANLVPLLKPDYVASAIFSGILINQSVILLPRSLYFSLFLKGFMPIQALNQLFRILEGDTSMNSFTGRLEQPKP
ncbi:Short-chain dehydrogenase/reductase family 16C member 6 [Halotydeus destructor]|nr:Short-chain dehydrogenase/reductase family 16C member 6 [Halotydeus destructor]